MRRTLVAWLGASAVAVLGAVGAWLWFAGGSGEPTTVLTTPSVTLASTAPTTATTSGEDPDDSDDAVPIGFVIDSERSVAAFEIDEELRGQPKRVVGETDQVAGQVVVDPDDPSGARFSQIVVNARTLETDSARRDRAMRGPVILNSASDEFELITFDVISVEGLDGPLRVGDTLGFEVTGDLTIKGTSREVVFDVSVTFVDPFTIEGTAQTQVLRSDFDIGIPSVPGVANVSDEVTLSLDFVAVAG